MEDILFTNSWGRKELRDLSIYNQRGRFSGWAFYTKLLSSRVLENLYPMAEKYISLQQAAKLSGRSLQTIRRCVKSKKLKFKKEKTPQGFNYTVSEESLSELFNLNLTPKVEKQVKQKVEIEAEVKQEDPAGKMLVDVEDFKSFALTMERLVSQHAEERQSFLRLVNTLQEKIFVMENQINLLKAPSKKWYQLW